MRIATKSEKAILLAELENTLWNTIHKKPWTRVALLGKGGFGSVYIGQRVEDGMVFAVKSTVIASSTSRGSRFRVSVDAMYNEMMFLKTFRCKYIVRMLGCGRSDGTNSFRKEFPMLDLFLEYIPRGSLQHLMMRMNMGVSTAKSDIHHSLVPSNLQPVDLEHRKSRLPEDFVRAYTTDILKALDYLHKKQCVHGDIKPMNLLVGEGCLQLADFGGCKTLKKQKSNVFQIYTEAYSAPEVHYNLEQGLASDIFSLGCTVLEMTCGYVPCPVFIPQWMSNDGQNFLRRCLCYDLRKRWTAPQLLQHPFILDHDVNDTRPYSTTIPSEADRMILQPPPIQYTNSLLSPTFRGFEIMRLWSNVKTEPEIDTTYIDELYFKNPDPLRKEKIIFSTQSNPGTNVLLTSSATIIPQRHNSQDSLDTPLKDSSSDLQLVKFKPQPSIRGMTSYDTKSEPKEIEKIVKQDETILPKYKPEFETPRNNTIQFLLPNSALIDHHTDADPQALAKVQWFEVDQKDGVKGDRRPPTLIIPGNNSERHEHGPSSTKVLIENLLANICDEEVTKLNEALPRMAECNQVIIEEAMRAEEAGVYENKLCPSLLDQ